MKRPHQLIELLEDLAAAAVTGGVAVQEESYAIVYPDDESSGGEGLRLTSDECELVFASEDSVEHLHEALGCPTDASIMLHQLEIESRVQDALERHFSAVDEL